MEQCSIKCGNGGFRANAANPRLTSWFPCDNQKQMKTVFFSAEMFSSDVVLDDSPKKIFLLVAVTIITIIIIIIIVRTVEKLIFFTAGAIIIIGIIIFRYFLLPPLFLFPVPASPLDLPPSLNILNYNYGIFTVAVYDVYIAASSFLI
jgi:hypothetical protein